MSLYHPFGLYPFVCICVVVLDASKYTNMYRPFGRNSTVQIKALTPCIWTIQIYVSRPSIWTVQMDDGQLDRLCYVNLSVQMDDGPMDRLSYINLDCPNGQWSNGPPMFCKFGPSKWTAVLLTPYFTFIWTINLFYLIFTESAHWAYSVIE